MLFHKLTANYLELQQEENNIYVGETYRVKRLAIPNDQYVLFSCILCFLKHRGPLFLRSHKQCSGTSSGLVIRIYFPPGVLRKHTIKGRKLKLTKGKASTVTPCCLVSSLLYINYIYYYKNI